MNPTAEEMLSYLGAEPQSDETDILHYGTKRHSGRYPWGSGEDPYQHGDNRDFLGRVEALKKKGWTETAENIKKEFGVSINEYRYEKAICTAERRRLKYEQAKALQSDGLNTSEIARKMGMNESSVRSLFNPKSVEKMNEVKETADFLRKQVAEKKMIDVGKDVELELNISRDRLDTALYLLGGEGYGVYSGRIPQPTNPNQKTTQTVLCAPGIEHKEIYNYDKIKTITEYKSDDNGKTFRKFQYPESLDSKRLAIRYAEDGGIKKDGIVEIRRGVEDLSLGESRYSQVRIMVDGTHYIKGMAVYSDAKDWPPGVDVMFNTNKKKDKTKMEVLKPIKDDPDNPFGSLIKPDGQYTYIDKDGKERLGLINKRADQGDWGEWKDAVPSQMLGKQSTSLAKKQLDLAKADKMDEYQSIMEINNPTIRKYYLDKFASNCDKAAETLSAAAFPGQKYHVIVPINSLKDDEVYAPRYENGTKLALIRYPHGGTFEIPILTVNNKNKDGKDIIGDKSGDGIGITYKVAERLSGADFDGDTVMAIPTHDAGGKIKISSKPPLKDLEGFDSKSYQYQYKTKDDDGTEHYFRDGIEFQVMTKHNTQLEMGKVSNLITDMTLGGADDKELARAVKHSMVVIDAEKHKLDWKQSEKDNNIAELKQLYQKQVLPDGTVKYGGSSTLLSRAKSPENVTKRQGTARVNLKEKEYYDPTKPEGALLYKDAVDSKYTKVHKRRDGTTYETEETRTQRSTKMLETEDARTLISSGKYQMEQIYADYANAMKQMARDARVESAHTEGQKKNKEAAKEYAPEVASMTLRLNEALKNSVKERAAIRQTNAVISEKIEAGELDAKDKEHMRKASQQALTSARADLGGKSRKERNITLTDREWEAIQAGAVTDNFLQKLLNNCDPDDLRDRATPKDKKELSSATINHIKALANSNYTLNEIAERLNVSTSTVEKYMKKG